MIRGDVQPLTLKKTGKYVHESMLSDRKAALNTLVSKMDDSYVAYEPSVIVENERIPKKAKKNTELVQGANLVGKCSQPECKQQFVINLGIGVYEIGKKAKDFDNTRLYGDQSTPASIQQSIEPSLVITQSQQESKLSNTLSAEIRKRQALHEALL